MDCARCQELISEYIDSALDDQTVRMLEEHLADCEHCAEALREVRACVSVVGSLEPIKAPEDFLQRVHDRIRLDEPVSWPRWLREQLWSLGRLRIPLGAAGLVMTALLVVFIYQGARQRTQLEQVPAPIPTAVKPQQQPDTSLGDREQPALGESPAVRSAETKVESRVPGRRAAPAEETMPLRLTLMIGPGEHRGKTIADKEEARLGGQEPIGPPTTSSTIESEKKALLPPANGQPARPAGPSASRIGSVSRRKTSAETVPGREIPADGRLERDDGFMRGYGGGRRSEPPAAGTAPLHTSGKRETEMPSQAPAEIRMLAKQVGGGVEATNHKGFSGQPESLTVQIPSASLPRFLDGLRRIGRLGVPVKIPADNSGNATILVQITLEYLSHTERNK